MPTFKHGEGNVVVWHALGLVKWQICTGLRKVVGQILGINLINPALFIPKPPENMMDRCMILIGDFVFNSQKDNDRLLAEARGTKRNTVQRHGKKCRHHGKNHSQFTAENKLAC